MIDRARATGPVLLVDTGNVFASPYVWSRRRGKQREAFLAGVYRSWGYQVLALGWGDFRTLQDGIGRDLPWVSANGSAPGVRPFRVVRVGPWRVAVTGVTGKGKYPSTMDWRRPRKALKEALMEMPKDVDLILLLLASPAMGRGLSLKDVDLALGGVFGRGVDRRQGPPYVFWLRIPRGGQVGMVTLEKGEEGLRLVSFRPYSLDSKVPAAPRIKEEIRALIR